MIILLARDRTASDDASGLCQVKHLAEVIAGGITDVGRLELSLEEAP